MISVKFIENAGTTAIADWLEEQLCQSLNSSTGMIKINVPGGSTPFPIMEDLVSRDLDWTRIAIFPGDDRIVSENHKASNTGKIRAIFEPRGAVITPLTPDMVVPEWALSWLGMGADGHIASLFPNTNPEIDDRKKVRCLTPEPLPENAPFDRITLTIPALLNSSQILFTLGGSTEKLEVFSEALKTKSKLPVSLLLSAAKQRITCFT